MIPNTDINCGKCAAPIYSDCVMWSGGNLSCVTLLQDCCDTSLTKVVELLGDYICNMGSGLTWACVPSGTSSSIKDSLQAVITELSDRTISYNADHFIISGTGCSKELQINSGEWIDITSQVHFSYRFYSSDGSTPNKIEYKKDPITGDIHLRGYIWRLSSIDISGSVTGSGTPSSPYTVNGNKFNENGPEVYVCDLPSSLIPTTSTGFIHTQVIGTLNNNNGYTRGSTPKAETTTPWLIKLTPADSNSVPASYGLSNMRLSAYIPPSASGNTSTVGNGGIYLYLDGVIYSSL